MSGYTIEEKREIAGLETFYFRISKTITTSIKAHLNYAHKKFVKNVLGENSLSFQMPTMYLCKLEMGNIKTEMPITSANDYFAYSFLMFREISGDKAYDFGSNLIVSFKSGYKTVYSKADLLNTFKYNVNGQQAQAFINTNKHTKAPNKEVVSILKEDEIEVKKILENTFKLFIDDCKLLEKASDKNIELVCKDFTSYSMPDNFLEFYICLETFNLAQNMFCTPVLHDEL
jgi:hypothetical protein